MEKSNQNQNNKHSNNVENQKVNRALLWISILIFLSTFPYWFINTQTEISLINVLIKNTYRPNPYMASTGLASEKIRFFLHLASTVLGLYLFYKSKAPAWLGKKISITEPVAGYLHKNYRRAKTLKTTFQIAFGFIILLVVYMFILGVVNSDHYPTSQFSLFLILFFIYSAGWEIKFSPSVEDPISGKKSYLDEPKWITLLDNQIAYVKERNGKDTWNLHRDGDVDMSYTISYLIDINKFYIDLKNKTLISNDFGEIRYDCIISLYGISTNSSNNKELTIKNFPNVLNSDQLFKLVSLSTPKEGENLIVSLINQTDIKKVIQEKITEQSIEISSFIDKASTVNNSNWKPEYDRIIETIKQNQLENELNRQFQTLINESIFDDLLNVDLSIIKDTVYANFRKKIEEFKKVREANEGGERQIILSAIAKRMEAPGVSPEQMFKFLTLKEGLESGKVEPEQIQGNKSLMNTLLIADNPEKNDTEEYSKFKKISGEINEIMTDCTLQGYENEDTKEKIAKSVDFFKNENLSPDDFFELLYAKMNSKDEVDARKGEAVRQLIEDTLRELYERKK
ncbi:hypothetical protein V1387_04845 [Allomuricauda taeanensis]|uniref:hypothetical protein n=1 Tax=Flagellimonas taeanensis TaxID=1005926 RepID=UPI002E7B8C11|nr:hypothetical protein [Allomuricauda taeanensis]MEE1962003.1 hypothetical protein [Allomuricauda taeanensis]